MYCGGTCACLSCSNRIECADEVLDRRNQIISRDPEAFTHKVGGCGLLQKRVMLRLVMLLVLCMMLWGFCQSELLLGAEQLELCA
jgi:hypothetical protein